MSVTTEVAVTEGQIAHQELSAETIAVHELRVAVESSRAHGSLLRAAADLLDECSGWLLSAHEEWDRESDEWVLTVTIADA